MARVKALGGQRVAQYSSPNIGGKMSDHRGPVLHIAQGYYQGTINWQMNPNQRYASGGSTTTSSTWIVGKETGEIAQMVDTDWIAWTQRDGSRTRTSIELVGFAPDKPTAWQIEMSAHILVWEHQHYGVPLQVADHDGQNGLGHHSMDREWLGVDWGHESCPGSGVIGAKDQIVARARQIQEGDDMALSSNDKRDIAREVYDIFTWHVREGQFSERNELFPEGYRVRPDKALELSWAYGKIGYRQHVELLANQKALLAAQAGDDVAAEVQRLLDESNQQLEAQIREAVEPLQESLDQLHGLFAQFQSGELTAEQVVQEIGDRLRSGRGSDDGVDDAGDDA